jgi:hypothetical protein
VFVELEVSRHVRQRQDDVAACTTERTRNERRVGDGHVSVS